MNKILATIYTIPATLATIGSAFEPISETEIGLIATIWALTLAGLFSLSLANN